MTAIDDDSNRYAGVLAASLEPGDGAAEAWAALRERLVAPRLRLGGGVLLAETRHGFIAEFSGIAPAAWFGVELQRAVASWNAELPAAQRRLLRVGIAVGEAGGSGSDGALALMRRSPPGGLVASGVADGGAASVVDADTLLGRRPQPRYRLWSAAAAAVLLAYFVGWWVLVWWRLQSAGDSGTMACWPSFMCG